MESKCPKLPVLSYGEGNMSWLEKEQKIIYKKQVDGRRLIVRGDTVQEVRKKMREREKQYLLELEATIESQGCLSTAMLYWLEHYRNMILRLRHMINWKE